MARMVWKYKRPRWKLIFAASAALAAVLVFVIESCRSSKGPSDPNKHEMAKSMELEVPHLEINSVVQHGDIFEIVGSAEGGSSVMINGQYAPLVFENSTFKYFVGPLRNGVTVLTVTVQNEYGGVDTKQVALTVP
jgi:hypothetical protein